MLTLRAFGRFYLVDEYGHEFAPAGQKARGLLVLVAVAPNHSRTRAWLQDKLWSDRSKGQASGSLRTCLVEIRKSLGVYSDILRADRTSVSLETEKFRVDFTQPEFLGEAFSAEPFEDIDINDPEFEHLIRDLRATVIDKLSVTPRLREIVAPNRKYTIQIVSDHRGGALAEIAAQFITQQIRDTLCWAGDFHTFACDAPWVTGVSDNPVSFMTLRLLIIETHGEVFASCSLHMPPDGAETWSTNTTVSGTPSEILNSVEVARLSLRVIEHISDIASRQANLGESAESALVLEYHAKQLLFQLDRNSLVEADRLFALAFEIEPRGQYLAWRGFLRNIAFFQHRTTAFLEDQTSILDFSVEALRHSPKHAIVQAIASQLDYIHQGDVKTSLTIARQAVELDSSSPMTWAFLSNALAASNRSEESYETACKSVALSVGSNTQFFFEHFACMSAVASEDYQRAMTHAQIALRFRPDFVSTRRYEVALAMQLNDGPSIQRSVEAMRKMESGFTPAMLLENSYPVTTMRRLPLIDAVR